MIWGKSPSIFLFWDVFGPYNNVFWNDLTKSACPQGMCTSVGEGTLTGTRADVRAHLCLDTCSSSLFSLSEFEFCAMTHFQWYGYIHRHTTRPLSLPLFHLLSVSKVHRCSSAHSPSLPPSSENLWSDFFFRHDLMHAKIWTLTKTRL